MADIYSKSYLTIAATRAQNSQHGFLFDFSDDTVCYKVLAEAPWDKDAYRTLHGTFQIHHEYSKSDSTPLNKRAWCLQEWYLPKRLVEFSLNDIRLICLRSVETRFGRTNDEHTHTRTIVRAFGMQREDAFRTFWENIRSDFFGRDLTKPSDMLPAMAGLAQMLETRLLGVPNHKYLAGLWSTRISEDLSWTVLEFDAATKPIEGVPTWTWASATTACGYIYGRPSKTYVDLVESHASGYARSREASASLKVNGFVTTSCLRVDPKYKGFDGRPSLSFWIDENAAIAATTEEIEARRKGSRSTGYIVLDMPICAIPHHHQIVRGANKPCLQKASSIARASGRQEQCKKCIENGFVSYVELLLLTRTDVSTTALVLAPVPPQSSKGRDGGLQKPEEVYHRLGLLELDCIRTTPWMETADGYKIPAETFWQTYDPSARRTITIV